MSSSQSVALPAAVSIAQPHSLSVARVDLGVLLDLGQHDLALGAAVLAALAAATPGNDDGVGRVEERAAIVARRVAELAAVMRRDAREVEARLQNVVVAARPVVMLQPVALHGSGVGSGPQTLLVLTRHVRLVRLLVAPVGEPRVPVMTSRSLRSIRPLAEVLDVNVVSAVARAAEGDRGLGELADSARLLLSLAHGGVGGGHGRARLEASAVREAGGFEEATTPSLLEV